MVSQGDVLRWLVAALIADTAVVAWCRQTYGRPPLIQVGNDVTQDPRQWRMPAIVLVPERRDGSPEHAAGSLITLIELRIRCEKVEASAETLDSSPLRETDGLYQLDEFARRVKAAIAGKLAQTAVCLEANMSETFDTEQLFPICVAELRLTLNLPPIIGVAATLE